MNLEMSELCDELERIASDKRNPLHNVAREMLDAYNQGMADRVNGAGEFEDDD
jgi:hypothetical protein